MERQKTLDTLWGSNQNSHLLAEMIDEIMKNPDFTQREKASAVWLPLLTAPLICEGVSQENVEHLNILFTHPKPLDGIVPFDDPDLRKIQEILLENFGQEVLRRINVSISPEKVQTHIGKW